MRAALIGMTCILLANTGAWAGANCAHSASWQCGAHLGGAEQGSQTGGGISTTGHSPDTGTTNPHLGTIDTGGPQPPVAVVPQEVIAPLQPPAQKVPTPLPPAKVKVPTPIAQKVPQPIKVPPQPPEQRVPVPQKLKAPPQLTQREPQLVVAPPQLPAQRVPMPQKDRSPPESLQRVPLLATPHPTDVHTGPAQTAMRPHGMVPHPVHTVNGSRLPEGGTAAVAKPGPRPHKTVAVAHSQSPLTVQPHVVATTGRPTPVVTGGQVAEGHTHYLVPTRPNIQLPHTIGASIWLEEVVEPGIQNHRVELYRSNDAEEILYGDAIPMDKTGFHLKVFGTRPPNYH